MQVREAAPLLAQLKQPGPLDLHDAGKENVKVRVMREMQQGALSANNGTTAAVGSVLMQLLMMQLNARSLHPLFRQPIPWHFVSPAPAGTAANYSTPEVTRAVTMSADCCITSFVRTQQAGHHA